MNIELTSAQREALLRPLNPKRVLRDGKGMSHLPAYDVVAHLTRIFGFEGWDKEVTSLHLIREYTESYTNSRNEAKSGWNVTYGCTMRLKIYALTDDHERQLIKVIDDGATGSAVHMPDYGDAHDFAMKNAISYAIKRCAKDLGDQFGLSLYNKGSVAALLLKVVPYDLLAPGTPPDDEVPEPKSMGNDERDEEEYGVDLDDPKHADF